MWPPRCDDMPIYQFRCTNCGYENEEFFRMKNVPHHIFCEECGEIAKRIYNVQAPINKKKRVGDIWDKQGIEPAKSPKMNKDGSFELPSNIDAQRAYIKNIKREFEKK